MRPARAPCPWAAAVMGPSLPTLRSSRLEARPLRSCLGPREACWAPQGTLRPRGGRRQPRLCLLVCGRGRGLRLNTCVDRCVHVGKNLPELSEG